MASASGPYDLSPRLRAFAAGEDSRCYEWLGCHYAGDGGYTFRVWAPTATAVSLVGEFCGWDPSAQPMERMVDGLWECTLQHVGAYSAYGYHIVNKDGQAVQTADPLATCRREDVSLVHTVGGGAHTQRPVTDCPPNVYEVHPPSWRRYAGGAVFSYEALQEELIPYVRELGFTHLRLLAFATGFAPPPCHGTPEAFRGFVEACHAAGLGVLLDWLPPSEETPAAHSIALSRAVFWLEEYGIDGLWAQGDTAAHPLWRQLQTLCPQALLAQEAPGDVRPSADRSLLAGMPGDYEQQLAGVRSLLAYRLLSPGPRRLFMGDEFGQQKPWDPDGSLDWLLLDYEDNRLLRHYVTTLNHLYRETPALWAGAVWTGEDGVLTAYMKDGLTAVCNTTPTRRDGVRIGLTDGGDHAVLFYSDLIQFGGDSREGPSIRPQLQPTEGRAYSAELTLPPLSVVLIQKRDDQS